MYMMPKVSHMSKYASNNLISLQVNPTVAFPSNTVQGSPRGMFSVSIGAFAESFQLLSLLRLRKRTAIWEVSSLSLLSHVYSVMDSMFSSERYLQISTMSASHQTQRSWYAHSAI